MDGTFLDLSFVLCETLHSITSSLLESLINSHALHITAFLYVYFVCLIGYLCQNEGRLAIGVPVLVR